VERRIDEGVVTAVAAYNAAAVEPARVAEHVAYLRRLAAEFPWEQEPLALRFGADGRFIYVPPALVFDPGEPA
jgi:hypothetical protein